MKDKILIFDDLIDLEYQEKIKNILISNEKYKGFYFPWYFTDDVTKEGDSNSQKRPAFFHGYVNCNDGEIGGSVDSVFHELFVSLVQNSCLAIDKTNVSIMKGRSFLQLPSNFKGPRADTPHVDTADGYFIDHFVMLYYVCDSDGDTILYNEQATSNNRFFKKHDKYTIQKRVTPKQGRVVLFDGSYYHTAEQPIDNIRCIVNYDLVEC